MQRRLTVLLLPFLALPACTEQATRIPNGAVVQYEDANEREGVDVSAADTEGAASAETGEQGPGSVSFGEVRITPEKPTVDSVLKAEVDFKASGPDSMYAEYDLTWYINDLELVGYRADVLNSRIRRFKKGDGIRIEVSSIAPNGESVESRSEVLFIANSIPRILTDESKRDGIDGLRMKADDPDGDPITWSIVQGPPGVTIDRGGKIRVEHQNLAEDYDGEVVVAASDPEGARAEHHIPVFVNARVEEKMGERTVTKTHTRRTMTDAEYEKANLDNLDRVEAMSAEDFEKHMEAQLEADAALEKK